MIAKHHKLKANNARVSAESWTCELCLIDVLQFDEQFRERASKIWSHEHPETFKVLKASEFRRM